MKLAAVIEDRHFAEAIYAVALAGGVMDRVTYQELPEERMVYWIMPVLEFGVIDVPQSMKFVDSTSSEIVGKV